MATWDVGSGQTYSEIQGAVDAIDALYGGGNFTETETVVCHDGSSAGQALDVQATISPTATYKLLIQGETRDGYDMYPYGFAVRPDYVEISLLKLGSDTVPSVAVWLAGDYGLLASCTVGNSTDKSQKWITIGSGATSTVIRDCAMHFTDLAWRLEAGTMQRCTAISESASRMLYMRDGSGATTCLISACLFVQTIPTGSNNIINFDRRYAGDSMTLQNCTIYTPISYIGMTGADGYGVISDGIYASAGAAIIRNNIVYAPNLAVGACFGRMAGGFTSDYNLCYTAGASWGVSGNPATYYDLATWRSTFSRDVNSLATDPIFKNGGYDIEGWSPAVNAGTSTGAPATDIENTAWPNANPEMGCYGEAAGTPPKRLMAQKA